MSFFSQQKPAARKSSISANSMSVNISSIKGDRIIVDRTKHEANTVSSTNTSLQKYVDKIPNGCLFKIGGGFFDKDGYWCRRLTGHEVEVSRNSPRRIMKLLTEEQKNELLRVRNKAKRNGIR